MFQKTLTIALALLIPASLMAMPMSENERALRANGWTLALLDGQPLIPETSISLYVEENGIGGNASCNGYSGDVSVGDGVLSLSELMSTTMACMDPPGIYEQETKFLRLLYEVEEYSVQEGQLQLSIAGRAVMVFDPIKPILDAPLSPGNWELGTISRGMMAYTSVEFEGISIDFSGDQFTLTLPCHLITGSFDTQEMRLATQEVKTLICPDGPMEDEDFLVELMEENPKYLIQGKTLTLIHSSEDSVTFFLNE